MSLRCISHSKIQSVCSDCSMMQPKIQDMEKYGKWGSQELVPRGFSWCKVKADPADTPLLPGFERNLGQARTSSSLE